MRVPTASSYSTHQKAAHWFIAVICLSQFPTAWAIQRTHIVHASGLDPAPFDLFLHKVHAWSGWTIFLLGLILLASRAIRGAPDLPAGTSAWQRWLAHVGHLSLYGGIAVLAVTGTGAMYLSQGFAPIHILFVNIGMGLVGLHVAAVIWHQVIRRDRLLWRMMPKRESIRRLGQLRCRNSIDQEKVRSGWQEDGAA